MTDPASVVEVVGGVDTHQQTHTAAVVDGLGGLLGCGVFPATAAGYTALLGWMRGFGRLVRVGVEGTGSYGAGLARHLAAAGVAVVEVDRPDRAVRRRQGKSDPIDAVAAARAALAGTAAGTPKAGSGQVEALRTLRVARTSAIRHRAQVQQQVKSLLVTAPEPLRARLRGLPTAALLATCAAFRPAPGRVGDPTTATKIALRVLARRHTQLSTEIRDLDTLIGSLVAAINPRMLAADGIGVETAGKLLVAAGDNPQRLHSEAAFAMLTGTAPLPASSGRTTRHRLNRGGDRQANCALHQIVICRMSYHPATRAYVTRRTTEGLSKKEIIRCLKRYVAREIYHLLLPPPPAQQDRETAA